MTPLVKILIWLTLAVLLVLAVLFVDVRRTVAKAGRVTIQSDSQAELILSRFPFEESYRARVVDEVPKTKWLILLRLFPRHSQRVFVDRLAWLDTRQKASLVASHAHLFNRSGALVAGLDRAAQTWIGVPLEKATPEQLDQLATHQKRGKSKSAKPPPAKPSPRPSAPAGAVPR